MPDDDPQAKFSHPLGQQLQSLGITKAAIIDDAYDVPSRANLVGGEVADFWGQIERDDDLVEAVRAIDQGVADADSTSDQVIATLWSRRDDGSRIADAAKKHLFATALARLSDVNALEANLRTLSLDVDRFGSDFRSPDPSVKLIFVDYFLGPTPDSVSAAKLMARRAFENGTTPDRPFIVLMSSEAGVERLKEEFRDDSKIVAGLFDFVHKPNLRAGQSLNLKLATWALGLRERYDIQGFVDALAESVDQLSDRFMRRVRALGIEDYAYLQKLKLHVDGHPLGDYMLWLFGSLLPHLAFDESKAVRDRRAKLDSTRFTELLPSHWKPSAELAETYGLAICEPSVDDFGPHPLDHLQAAPKGLPWLRLGDLLLDEQNRVLMVANAACSIAFAPGSDRDDPDRYVVLIPGRLSDAEAPTSPTVATAEHVTEPIKLAGDGVARKIVWDCKRPVYQKHGTVAEWLAQQQFRRRARLRLPYALQLQQAYLAHQTRVGMPVPPPRVATADLELWFEGEDGKCARLGDTVLEGVRVIDLGEDKKFVLSVDAVSRLLAGVEAVVAGQQGKLTSLETAKGKDWEPRAESVREKIEGLRKLADSPEEWRNIMKYEADLPNAKTPAFLVKGVVHAWCGGDFNDRYKNRPPVCLNIRLKDGSGTVPSAPQPKGTDE